MDLKLFFNPIGKEIAVNSITPSSLANSLYINEEAFPETDEMDIAIIGLQEARGAEEVNQEGISRSADEIRKQLYSLKRGSGNLKVIDLGNFRNGPELEDSYQRLKEVSAFLMEENILPLIIGGSHNMDIGQYLGYESQDKLITLLSIDNKLDLGDPKTGIPNQSHVHRIFKHDPNYLFNYSQLGYQSYLVDQRETELLEKLYFEAVRLGLIKENVQELEPTIRDADMISFDLSALQAHYAPGGTDSKVYGLTGEEACQICWYAGLNDKLSSIGFYGYDVNKDTEDHKSSFVVATMIWYFLEGFYNRKGDKNFHSDDYLIYEVSIGGDPASIKFHKSKISEKWWMEIPNPNEETGFIKSHMIPCSYSDYETALKGEVPNKWIKTYSKMV